MKNTLRIDRRKKMDLNEQVFHAIKSYVSSNTLLPDSILPTVDELSLFLDVEAYPITQSLEILTKDGLLEKRGQDYYKIQKLVNILDENTQFYSLTQLAKILNLESSIETLDKSYVDSIGPLPLDYCAKDGRFLKIQRINTFNGKHKAWIVFNLHESFLTQLKLELFKDQSYYEVIKSLYKPEYVTHRLESIIEAKGEALKRLSLPKQSALLKSYQLVLDEFNEVVIYLEMYTAYEIFYTFQKLIYPKA